jgi:cytochrome c-type biogenesis protein CcmH
MTLWFIFAGMAVVALALVLLPLLRSLRQGKQTAVGPARLDYDLTVYRDQLGEIDRDLDRGVLTTDQAGAARIEVQRRMLGAADRAGKGSAQVVPRLGGTKRLVVALTVLVPVAAFGLYTQLGSPEMTDHPAGDRNQQIQAMVSRLAERLQQNPNDGKGWTMLGRSYRVMGENAKAMEAYKKAIAVMPGEVAPRLEYAGVLLNQSGGTAPDFIAVMREILAIDPAQPDALFFVGQAEATVGNAGKARTYWVRLRDQLPADSSERAEVVKKLEGLR